jgi:outer membrane protein assembly factor BamB
VLYVGAEDQFVHAIDVTGPRGIRLWDQSEDKGRTGWYINSAIAFADGPCLIVASRDERLYCFSLTGDCTWKIDLPGQVIGSPVVGAGNRVYLGVGQIERGSVGEGCLLCLDAVTGAIHWRFKADGPVESTPVVGDDGVVYFGDNAGSVHAVNRNGKRDWLEKVGAPVRSAGCIISNGRVAFGTDDGKVLAFRCTSKGLSQGWPKLLGSLAQSGAATDA